MQIRRGEKRVQPPPFGSVERAGGFFDVLPAAAGERRDDRAPHLTRDLPDRFSVGGRGDRKAGFDDVDAQRIEGPGEGHLGRDAQGKAGRLLAVAKRGVEDQDAGGIIAHTELL